MGRWRAATRALRDRRYSDDLTIAVIVPSCACGRFSCVPVPRLNSSTRDYRRSGCSRLRRPGLCPSPSVCPVQAETRDDGTPGASVGVHWRKIARAAGYANHFASGRAPRAGFWTLSPVRKTAGTTPAATHAQAASRASHRTRSARTEPRKSRHMCSSLTQ